MINNVIDRNLAYKNSADNLSKVRISGKTINVKGVLTSEVKLHGSATWDKLLSSMGGLDKYLDFAKKAGSHVGQSGMLTKQYFKDGARLDFTLDFKIVDWDGKSNEYDVVNIAKKLTQLTMVQNYNAIDIKKQDTPGKSKMENFFSGGHVKSSLGGAPSTVYIQISNFINTGNVRNYGQMIVKSVDATFSKEMTNRGPLFANFSVSVESLYILTSGNLSAMITPTRNRITYKGKGKI